MGMKDYSKDEIEAKIGHLRDLLNQIELGGRYENDFSKLYVLLEAEYELEGGRHAPYVMGNYRHNLEQTMWKQADSYRDAKRRRPVKGALSEYRDFISNFKQDVTDELYRWEYRLRTTVGERDI